MERGKDEGEECVESKLREEERRFKMRWMKVKERGDSQKNKGKKRRRDEGKEGDRC